GPPAEVGRTRAEGPVVARVVHRAHRAGRLPTAGPPLTPRSPPYPCPQESPDAPGSIATRCGDPATLFLVVAPPCAGGVGASVHEQEAGVGVDRPRPARRRRRSPARPRPCSAGWPGPVYGSGCCSARA